ncbi:MAG: hypothetical protein AAF519_01955, partial [Bacteroidota bacterium]
DLMMINDHGNPFLYFIDTSSYRIKKTIYLNNQIKDWEDITLSDNEDIYIGDFGNNFNKRKDLKIYKIPSSKDSSENIVTAEIIRFSLPDQTQFPPKRSDYEFDIEAMSYFKNSLYLFTKSRGIPFKGLVKIYKLPIEAGEYVAELVGSINLGNGPMLENWITAADIEENRMVLLSHNKLFVYDCITIDNIFPGQPRVIELNHFSQKEAICFINDTKKLFISDERTEGVFGGNLYEIDLNIVSPCVN